MFEQYFCQQMGMLLQSGLKPVVALRELALQNNPITWQEKIEKVNDLVFSGNTFSQSMSAIDSFDDNLLSLIENSESTSSVKESFQMWTQWLEWQNAWKKRLIDKLRYPIIVLLVVLTALLIAIWFILPNLRLFEASGGELPIVSRWMLIIFDYPVVFISSVLFMLAFLYSVRNRLKKTIALLLNRNSFINATVQEFEAMRFFHVLQLLHCANLALERQLQIGCKIIRVSAFKKEWIEIHQRLLNGEPFSLVLSNYPHWPNVIGHLIANCRHLKDFEKAWEQLAHYFEERVNTKVNKIEPVIEPVLTSITGLIVVGFVMLFLLPMYAG